MNVDPELVLAALQRARGKGLSSKQLSGQLHLGQARQQELRKALAQLLKDGRAVYDGHVYREAPKAKAQPQPEEPLPVKRMAPAALLEGARQKRAQQQGRSSAAGEVTGVIHLKSEGYGFVSPLLGGGGRENDVFIPPQFVKGALDGDVVLVRSVRGRDGRMAGEVTEVIERRRQLALGIYQAKGAACWVIPHDRSLTENINVPRHPKARDGDMVKVRLQRDESHGPLRGEVISTLGTRGDPRFEILASAYAEGFSDEFDKATLIAAESIPDRVLPEELPARRDLRHLPLVTIDGEDARDFDDAVYVSRTSNGYRLVVAIADVAHYVKPGGPLDREALRRATSVYFPGTVLPMLPERLSNGICSLNPDVDRMCMVCDLALDKTGKPLQADLYEAVMRSHARLTYTAVAESLAGGGEIKQLAEDLRTANELAKKLTAQRRTRGSIDFDLPENKILLDDEGQVAQIVRRPRNDAHRLVEEFMLAANEAVARFFDVRGLPTVYRIHDVPDEEKLEAFAALARSHGFELPAREELTPSVLNQFLKAVEGKPAQKALNSLLLRAMMQAQYSPDNIGHYGLAAPTYLHFTSPIRRYPDLMVHRLLKEHWARGGQPLREHERDEQEQYLAGVAAQCSDRERASMKAERDVDAFYAALFMQHHLGEKHKAVVAGVADFGLFCELEDLFVEGLVPAESLGEGVKLDKENQRLIIGKSGRSYGVGDEVLVEVLSADPARRRVNFGLAEKGVYSEKWLRPEDITSAAAPKKKAQHRPPPRGSPPGRQNRRPQKQGRRR